MLLASPKVTAQRVENGTCDVPVVVADYHNRVAPDLQKRDFSVRFAGTLVPVSSATIDEGPKRIALILDASAKIPEDEWNFELETATLLTQHARPIDRFALFVVGAETAEHAFLTSDETAVRIKKVHRSKAPEKTYEALLSALKTLGTAQFGDTVFLIGHDEDSGSTTTFAEVRELLLNKNVRFYGVDFADKLSKLPPGFDLNKPLPLGFGPSKLEALSSETGYFFSFHTVRALQMPGQEPLFKGFLADLYDWIVQPYRLSFANPNISGPLAVEVDAAQMAAREIRKSGMHYPHFANCRLAAAGP
jgi:hypothetical protein